MSHVQDTCDVGRWNDNGVRITIIRGGVKVTSLKPMSVPLVFGQRGVVLGWNVHDDVFRVGVGAQKYPHSSNKATPRDGFALYHENLLLLFACGWRACGGLLHWNASTVAQVRRLHFAFDANHLGWLIGRI